MRTSPMTCNLKKSAFSTHSRPMWGKTTSASPSLSISSTLPMSPFSNFLKAIFTVTSLPTVGTSAFFLLGPGLAGLRRARLLLLPYGALHLLGHVPGRAAARRQRAGAARSAWSRAAARRCGVAGEMGDGGEDLRRLLVVLHPAVPHLARGRGAFVAATGSTTPAPAPSRNVVRVCG